MTMSRMRQFFFGEYVSHLKDTNNTEDRGEKTVLRNWDFSTKREIRAFQQRLFGVVWTVRDRWSMKFDT